VGTWYHHLADGGVIFDARGAEHYGFDGDHASLAEVMARVHPEDAERVAATLGKAFDPALGTGRCAVDYRVRLPGGAVRWLSVQARVDFEGEGVHRRAVLAFGTSLDITERKHAEEELRRADRQKSEFLAVLSHELRNPLAPIRNSIHLLERVPPGSDVARRAREVLRRQSEHLTRLVDDLLDITRITHGRLELQLAPVDAGDVTRRACSDAASQFQEREVELELDAPREPLRVLADEVRLAQMIANLLTNALRFTPAGGRVRLAAREDRGRCVIRVVDSGIGIAPGDLERIFEPFVQGERRPPGHSGLGIGLALVKELAAKQGGSIRATSRGAGLGAEFVIDLPALASGSTPAVVLAD
jgi:signal transduction histidine kinase